MALMEKSGVTGAEGLGSRFELSEDGGATWHRVRGQSDTTYDAGERASQTIATYDGTFTILGAEDVGDVRGQIDAWTPNLAFWQILQTAKKENRDLLFRILTPPASTIIAPLAGRLATLATGTGAFAVTAPAAGSAAREMLDSLFSGTAIQVGHVLRVAADDRYRTIEEVQVDPDVVDGAANRWTVKVLPAPAANVAAGTFIVAKPRFRAGPFLGGVKKVGSIALPVTGALGTELVITPNQSLDLPQLANSASAAP